MLRTSPLPVTHLGAGDRPRTLAWAMSSTSAEPPIGIATHYVRPLVATAGRTCRTAGGPAGWGGPPRRPRPRPCAGTGPGPRHLRWSLSSLPLARCQGMAPAASKRGGGAIALLLQGDPPH